MDNFWRIAIIGVWYYNTAMIPITFVSRPPSVNAMYRNGGKGRGRFKTKQYEKWLLQNRVALLKVPKMGPGRYGLIVIMKKRANADVSNYIKPIEDILVKAGITPDDSNNIYVSAMPIEHDVCCALILTEVEAMELRLGIASKFADFFSVNL